MRSVLPSTRYRSVTCIGTGAVPVAVITTFMSTVPSAPQALAGLNVNVPVIWAAPRDSTSEAVTTYSPASEQVVTSAWTLRTTVGQTIRQMANTVRGDVMVSRARESRRGVTRAVCLLSELSQQLSRH